VVAGVLLSVPFESSWLKEQETPPLLTSSENTWNYQEAQATPEALAWAETPAPRVERLQRQPLDMNYREVAQFLNQRMRRYSSASSIEATANQIIRLCHLLGFQPSLVLAVIEHESSFRPHAISPMGAIGLMQLLPATARIVGAPIGIEVPYGGANLKDPLVNVTLGMHYLAQLHDDFKTLASTLAAYNLGPERWKNYLMQSGSRRPKTVGKYVALIERSTKRIRSVDPAQLDSFRL
jgi:soluble lytic murein transglycosylase